MQRDLTSKLGITIPIIQGGMAWVSGSRLASAVSRAGGLGVLGSATMDPSHLRNEIREVQARTANTFAVNLPLIRLRADGEDRLEELVQIILDEKVPVIITGAGSPSRYTSTLKAAGRMVGHVVPSPRLALKAEGAGVDFIVAESSEAGGHIRPGGLATLSLIPQVVDAVSVPVVAAGGIVDGRGVAAALALGASAVQLGTRFVATVECEAHPAFKKSLVRAGSEDAVVYGPPGQVSRGLATPAVQRMVEMEQAGATADELREVRGTDRARRGCVEGEVDEGILPSGSGVGLVRELPTVAELLEELMSGASERSEALARAIRSRQAVT